MFSNTSRPFPGKLPLIQISFGIFTNNLGGSRRTNPYIDQVFAEAWGFLENRLRQGYCPLILERIASLEISRSLIGSDHYAVVKAVLYLLHISFPTQCVAAVPGMEMAMQRILDRQVGK